MKPRIQILVVEDSDDDYQLLLATLGRQGVNAYCERVETGPDMAAALRRQAWDLVISDHHLPAFSSEGALQTLREHNSYMPFMIVSGTIGEDTAVAAMRAGADDYLIKGRLTRLGAAIDRALDAARARREREQAQTELAESRRQLQLLSAHLQTSTEAERRAIAREIHDDVGSALTALKFDLEWISRHADAAAAQRSREAMLMLQEAQTASQRIMRNLRPPILEAGLVPALQWLAAQFRQRQAMTLDLKINRDRIDIADELALTVFRTVQEALTNVGKHSNARHAAVDVVLDDTQLSVEISDDGQGLGAGDLEKSGSFGLRGLIERAAAAGGWLEAYRGNPGTTVLLTLEIAAPKS